jgi:hydrogenase nickel incorporation protein HypA/HybF
MHELGYCEAIRDAVERRAQGRAVARLGVRVGTFHRIVPDAFAQSFALVAAGGVAADAVPQLVAVPAAGRCWDCSSTFAADDPSAACPACGSLEVHLDGGDELVLEWIEYRAPEHAAEQAGEPLSEAGEPHEHPEPASASTATGS